MPVVQMQATGPEDDRREIELRSPVVDESLAKGSFDGTPVGSGLRIYTLVKRVQVSGLHDMYLTAVDARDGTLIWRRHISSSAQQQGNRIVPSGQMVLHAGRIYVSDHRGAIAYAGEGEGS